jgi:hypothetical protein
LKLLHRLVQNLRRERRRWFLGRLCRGFLGLPSKLLKLLFGFLEENVLRFAEDPEELIILKEFLEVCPVDLVAESAKEVESPVVLVFLSLSTDLGFFLLALWELSQLFQCELWPWWGVYAISQVDQPRAFPLGQVMKRRFLILELLDEASPERPLRFRLA